VYVLYREENLPFGEEEKKKLLDNNIQEIFIKRSDKKAFFSYMEKNLDKVIADKTISFPKKAELLYGTSKELVIDIFENPNTSDNIKYSLKIISNVMGLIVSSKSSLGYLLKVSSHDYYTYTHSINVNIYSIALGHKLNIFSKKEIIELGWGALLHDVGKAKVPAEIINKDGNLTDKEFACIKKHPEYGAAILEKTNVIPEKSYLPVLEHQEKGDGSGYPKGLKLKEISDFGKITAICDVYDALTSNKSYKHALSTYDAFKVMASLKGQFEPEFFKTFIILMS